MSEWLIDENIPGPGERPGWLKPKFKSVAEMAKAYDALEKIKDPEVPETYNLESIREKIDIDSDQVLDFLNTAKKNKVSEEVVLKAFNTVEVFGKPFKEPKAEELSEDVLAIKGTVNQWIANNFDDEVKAQFEKVANSSDVINAMNEIRKQSYKLKNQTPAGTVVVEPLQTLEQVHNEIRANYQKYKTDANYRGKLQERMEQISGQQKDV